MERVFRIRQWKSGGIIMPSRFSEFKSGARLVYDEERLYATKIRQLEKRADYLNHEYIRLAITGEEFINGQWKVLYFYPPNFNYEEHVY